MPILVITNPRDSTPQSSSYTATYHPSRKLSKLDEPDMPDTAGEVRKQRVVDIEKGAFGSPFTSVTNFTYYIYIYIYIYIYLIPGQVIPKTHKMVLDFA